MTHDNEPPMFGSSAVFGVAGASAELSPPERQATASSSKGYCVASGRAPGLREPLRVCNF